MTTVDALADAINRNPVWQSPLFSWMLSLFTATHLPVLSEGARSSAFEGAQSTSGAKQIATDFLKYVGKHDLHEAVLAMTPTQVQVVAIFHAQLQARPRKRVQLTERWEFLQQKPAYVPASEVHSPATPHFALGADAADESHGRAVLQAPVVCQLCGAGCLSRQALWRHCELRHHSWCEYRKRLIFEVQQRNAVPLRPVEKRRLAGNYMQDLLHSYPGRGTVKPGECTMRQVVACAVCAVKDWIDDYYPWYLWQDAPSLHQSTQMPENEENSEVEDGEEQQQRERPSRRRGPQLRGEDGVCFLGPADKVHKLLDVEKYVPVVPLVPPGELHASSVQHPSFPEMRWLLHTKRVPVLQGGVSGGSGGQGAAEHGLTEGTAAEPSDASRPPCAGVGDREQTAWL